MIGELLILFLTIGIILLLSDNRIKYYRTLLLLGFIVRVACLYVDYFHVVQFPGSGGDTEMFDLIARSNYELQRDNWRTVTNYSVVLSYIYIFTDCNRFFAQYLNVVLAVIFLYYFVRTVRLVSNDVSLNKKVIFLMTIFPNLCICSCLLAREEWIHCSLMISVFYFVNWFLGGKSNNFYKAIVFVFIASYMHSGCIMLIVGYLLTFMLYNRRKCELNINKQTIFGMMLLFVVVIVFFNNISLFGGKFASLTESDVVDDEILEKATVSRANSSYLTWINPESMTQLILFSPLKMFYFLFSPIPFDWRGVTDVVVFLVDSLVYLFFVIKIISGKNLIEIFDILRKSLVVTFLFFVFVFALGTTNAGAAMRHRSKIVALLAITYVVSLKKKEQQDTTFCIQ